MRHYVYSTLHYSSEADQCSAFCGGKPWSSQDCTYSWYNNYSWPITVQPRTIILLNRSQRACPKPLIID